MDTLLQWDEPQMYADMSFYNEVNSLLVFLMHEDNTIQHLSIKQASLLEHLVSGALEATCSAFEKAKPKHQHEMIEILEALSNFAQEITQ